MTVSNCQKMMKILIQEYANDTKDYEIAKEVELTLYQRWNDLGISDPNSEYLNEGVFRSVYSNSKLDIFPLINLITHSL